MGSKFKRISKLGDFGGGVGRGFRGLLGFGTLSLQGFRVLGF
jgi:hypothetical protein